MKGHDSGVRDFGALGGGLRCRVQKRLVHGVWQQRHVWLTDHKGGERDTPLAEPWIRACQSPPDPDHFREVDDLDDAAGLNPTKGETHEEQT